MKLNESFIPDEEIRQDYNKIESSPSIDVKREIGAKYGLQRNECTRWQNIAIAILEYLRTIRNHKDQFTQQDVHDFFKLTNYIGQYEKLKPYLNLESGKFIKYVLDFEYSHLLSTGIKPYTLDNIDTVKLTRDIYGSLQRRFWLERYKSIKKFYDEQYGLKAGKAESDNRKTYELQSMLIEETYEYRMQLEQYLENFILECYDIYKYGSSEYIKIYKLMEHYYDLIKERNPYYEPHHKADSDELKWIKYRDSLHFLIAAYNYFNEEAHFSSHPSREKRIEMSIDYFNQHFDKLIDKNIIKPLIAKDIDIDSIKIGDLEHVEFGFYFTISYNDNKKMYVNFILQHDFQDTSDMDEFIKHTRLYNTNIVNVSTICYQMKVSAKPFKESNLLNEGFDFNKIGLALDDYEDDNQLSSKSNIVKNANVISETMGFICQFIDLGLPSGTLWCKYNLGVNPEELDTYGCWHGDFYAWGEIKPKPANKNYCWTTYKWARGAYNQLSKYVSNPGLAGKNPGLYSYSGMSSVRFNDGLKELLPEDDAAYQNFYINNIHSHIPTAAQTKELLDNTTYEMCENYNNIKDLNGIKLISKINGKEIFFPFTGYSDNGTIHHYPSYDPGAYMWTSTLGTHYYEYDAYFLGLMTNDRVYHLELRYMGLPIRPVLNLS